MNELKLRMEYPAKLLSRNVDNFSLEWCENAVLACAETDYQMKNSPLAGETLLESLFLRLVGDR
jgi:DNA polymerase III delta subunit